MSRPMPTLAWVIQSRCLAVAAFPVIVAACAVTAIGVLLFAALTH